jgi:hypothetical protein
LPSALEASNGESTVIHPISFASFLIKSSHSNLHHSRPLQNRFGH